MDYQTDDTWTIREALDLYQLDRWSGGYFSVSPQGRVVATPEGPGNGEIDLKRLTDDLRARGIELPVLVRFSDIVATRVAEIQQAFADAIERAGYGGQYRGVYPIKVNQSRRVVGEVLGFGRKYGVGLEVGSKPELVAALACLEPGDLLICNGYKDHDYIRLALAAVQLGIEAVLVIEKATEVDTIFAVAEQVGVQPRLGLRARLAARGAGKWQGSTGDQSKFGLTATELVNTVARLEALDAIDCVELLHFHIGSQIAAIQAIKDALWEAGRLYVELVRLGCAQLRYCDVGGGLGVDYDGSHSDGPSSMNYSIAEYAYDVVQVIGQICDEASVDHPVIVTESGRAMSAHHSVLITEVVGVSTQPRVVDTDKLQDDAHAVATQLRDIIGSLRTQGEMSRDGLLANYHNLVDARRQTLQLFRLGHLSLEKRAYYEAVYWYACLRIVSRLDVDTTRDVPELAALREQLRDIYYCNFSLFQSLPDSWAIGQLFPVMPVHRLLERPRRRGVLVDLTCDSDGSLRRYIADVGSKPALELHEFHPGEPYVIGVFLVGAYQEILGDLHNLFGDENVVHVSLTESGGYRVDEVLAGDSIGEVLSYVGHSRDGLLREFRNRVERGVECGTITLAQSRQLIEVFRAQLDATTYLSRPPRV